MKKRAFRKINPKTIYFLECPFYHSNRTMDAVHTRIEAFIRLEVFFLNGNFDSEQLRQQQDENGNIHRNTGVEAALTKHATLFTVLGWVSAGLAAFLSPLFAIAGVAFGTLLNKQRSKSGNSIIITNVVVAAVNILFGLFIIASLQRMMLG